MVAPMFFSLFSDTCSFILSLLCLLDGGAAAAVLGAFRCVAVLLQCPFVYCFFELALQTRQPETLGCTTALLRRRLCALVLYGCIACM